VAVDPATTSGEESNETGIIVAAAGSDRRGYVLADLSLRGQPLEWARRAVGGYDAQKANNIVVETNQGGEMIRQTLRTVRPGVPVKEVRATRGKATRAEPISALYEQALISHVGRFDALEDQMCNWVPGMPSPDRMDAVVWAFTALYSHIGAQSTGGFG
jgi:phage terminase large subunit-like protein